MIRPAPPVPPTDASTPVTSLAPSSADAPARARTLRTDALGTADREAWRRLADRAAEPNPFFRPEFVLAAVEERGHPATLLVADQGEEWIACLPLRRARRFGPLPLPCLAPWLPEYAFLATPLVDRDRLDLAAAALAERLARERRAAALILDPLDPSGPVSAALMSALAAQRLSPRVYAEFERPALRRRPESTYLVEALEGKRRKDLRRQRRALEREVGGEVETVDRSTNPAAYDAFLELELRSWKGEGGTALASTGRDAAFFRRMCTEMSARGLLQILALEAGGRTLAMQCNVSDGDVLFAFKVAYDRAWSRFSPGVLLEVDAIDVFHDHVAASVVDSCSAPDNELLNRLWPDRRALQSVLVPTGALLARLGPPAIGTRAVARAVMHRARSLRARRP